VCAASCNNHLALLIRTLGAHLAVAPKTALGSLSGFIAARTLGTWTALGPGNIGGRTRTLLIDPGQPEIMYAGGVSGGVWKTTNGGRTWAVENTGFANTVTEWLEMGTDNEGSPWLFAFTHGRGAWKVRLSPHPPTPRSASGRRTP